MDIFNKVLSIDCENHYALMDKGLVFLEIGRYAEALDLFNKCLINGLDNYSLWFFLKLML
ncbi:tetratricopeptide repeat protein [Methanobrevibacter arboriphilus]|uniref:hypothetical protein n=1 Tax=Methanobrevibacter arboriphilus TaxID=39441 RepID=UPI000AAF1D21|nr:hypothetical protein [Methanobrevibacter arboriphilus]